MREWESISPQCERVAWKQFWRCGNKYKMFGYMNAVRWRLEGISSRDKIINFFKQSVKTFSKALECSVWVCAGVCECVGLKPKIIFVFRRQWAQAFSIAIALPNTWKIVPLSKILSVDAKLSWKFFSWCFTDQRIDANKLIYLMQKFFNVSQCAVTGFLCITFIFLGRESVESEREQERWSAHARNEMCMPLFAWHRRCIVYIL